MNTTDTFSAPPPIPEDATFDRIMLPQRAEHLRAWPWLLLAAGGAAAAFDTALWSENLFPYGLGGYGVAATIVLTLVSLVAMRRDLDRRSPVVVLLGLAAVASVWTGSGLSALLAGLLFFAWVRNPAESARQAGRTGFFSGIAVWVSGVFDAFGMFFSKIFRGRTSAWMAAWATGAFFLVLLAAGNAALAKYTDHLLRNIAEALSIGTRDVLHALFWCVGVLLFGHFAAARPVRKSEGLFVPVAKAAAPIPLAVLVGANLAFLASNLTDTYWLGFMRASPEGVSTTDYLYNGAYVLMADAALAGVLLLRIFRGDGAARGDGRAKLAGVALVIQCAWLGLGVAGRLALQMDKFGFTPVRLWGVVALIWGFIGLFGVWRFVSETPSLRRFLRLAGWSFVGLLSLLQFRSPAVLSVDLNIACHRARPEWVFDYHYYSEVGIDGWRLSRAIALEGGHPKDEAADGNDMYFRGKYWRHDFEGDQGFESDVTGYKHLDWRQKNLRTCALCREWDESGASGAASSQ